MRIVSLLSLPPEGPSRRATRFEEFEDIPGTTNPFLRGAEADTILPRAN
jgi:hypothetical protein